ncbi:MAG: hypothetical protein JNL38_07725 [Myxococcales bacterium]|nr:hypothetical protein [Myxococcales bacterium]
MGKVVLGASACAALLGVALISSCSYSNEADPRAFADGGAAQDGALGGDAPSGARDADGIVGPQLECPAQRVVHLVGGNGGFAWFSQVWPVPELVTAPMAAFAYDDPKLAVSAPSSTGHPLFARRVASRAVWEGSGKRPMPTAFVAGTNLTHTATPNTTRIGTVDVVAAGAALQKKLGAPIPVLRLGRAFIYGPAPLAPAAVDATDVDTAVTAIVKQLDLPASVESSLRPDPAVVAQWAGAGARASIVALARGLSFAANAFRLNLVSTILLPAMEDDPHGAFAGSGPGADTNAIAQVLDSFYRELQTRNEATCGHGGKALSLADNVVLLASGDTYKNPFDRGGWPDGTPDNSNVLYVRSNGYLLSGWFGRIASTGVVHFDTVTGAASTGATQAAATQAALQGVLYAIARGDGGAVSEALPLVSVPYQGVIDPSPP